MSNRDGGSSGCTLGCLPLMVSVLVLWALIFGVTYNGKHHDLSCSCSRGVDITEAPR